MTWSRPANTTRLTLLLTLFPDVLAELTEDILLELNEAPLKIPIGRLEKPAREERAVEEEQVEENPAEEELADKDDIYENVVINSDPVELDEKLDSSPLRVGFFRIPLGSWWRKSVEPSFDEFDVADNDSVSLVSFPLFLM